MFGEQLATELMPTMHNTPSVSAAPASKPPQQPPSGKAKPSGNTGTVNAQGHQNTRAIGRGPQAVPGSAQRSENAAKQRHEHVSQQQPRQAKALEPQQQTMSSSDGADRDNREEMEAVIRMRERVIIRSDQSLSYLILGASLTRVHRPIERGEKRGRAKRDHHPLSADHDDDHDCDRYVRVSVGSRLCAHSV